MPHRVQLQPPRPRSAIRWVALLEVMKGVVVLVAATGLVSLMHKDVAALVVKLVEHAHLNPASHYPHIFIEFASSVNDAGLAKLALGAGAYAALRLFEGYGLLRGRAWAEVLAAGSGAVYIPFEVAGLTKGFSGLALALLVVNVVVVAVMVMALWQRRTAAGASNP